MSEKCEEQYKDMQENTKRPGEEEEDKVEAWLESEAAAKWMSEYFLLFLKQSLNDEP